MTLRRRGSSPGQCYNSCVPKTITPLDLTNNSAAVLREVQGGETMVIASNGSPIAEIGPFVSRRFVPRAVIVNASRRAAPLSFANVRAGLDAVVDPWAES